MPKEVEDRVNEIINERYRDGLVDSGYSEEEIERMLNDYKRRMKGH